MAGERRGGHGPKDSSGAGRRPLRPVRAAAGPWAGGRYSEGRAAVARGGAARGLIGRVRAQKFYKWPPPAPPMMKRALPPPSSTQRHRRCEPRPPPPPPPRTGVTRRPVALGLVPGRDEALLLELGLDPGALNASR